MKFFETEYSKETEKAIRSVGRALRNLNKQIEIIRKEVPDAEYYMSCSTFSLLNGPSHIDGRENPDVEVIERQIISHADCGDW